MTINAQGYLEHLRSYLNLADYGKTCLAKEQKGNTENQLTISDTINENGDRQCVTLSFSGVAFAIKLDSKKDPLFHFLNNDGHPWARRCDFIVLHAYRNSVKAYCIEFKQASTRIPVDKAYLQLKSAEAWCATLNKILSAYIGETKRITLSKYIFTACRNPDPDLGPTNRYLRKYPSIRHYLFNEVDGMALEDL